MDQERTVFFSWLEDENDVKTLVRGLRLLDRIAHTEPLASRLDPAGDNHPELHHLLSNKTDEELAKLVRENVQTLYHPACTARMAPLEDGGVVDAFLHVHGIPNLRIVDASVFPTIVSGHTVSTVHTMPCVIRPADLYVKDRTCLRCS